MVDSAPFSTFIIGVILLNAALIGAATYIDDPGTLRVITAIEWGCVAVFAVEIVLRLIAAGSPRRYLSDGWNIFDVVIVAAAFIPATGGISPLLRVLRVFRVLRLIKALPELRLIVNVLVRSIVSMKYVALLAAVLFYVYAVIGVKLFGTEGHPLAAHFSSLHEACFTLFRILTGDDWTQMRYDLSHAGAPTGGFTLYQVSWIIVATFLLVNLIVGAVINNYQEVQEIERHRRSTADDRRLIELLAEMEALVRARHESARGSDPPPTP